MYLNTDYFASTYLLGNVNECLLTLLNTLNAEFLMKSCVLNALKIVIVNFLKEGFYMCLFPARVI